MIPAPSILDSDLVITLETPDGRVFTGKGFPVSLEYECDTIDVTTYGDDAPVFMAGRQQWTLEIVGNGRMEMSERETYTSATEWQCVYCRTPNERQARKCTECAAPRPFVYS